MGDLRPLYREQHDVWIYENLITPRSAKRELELSPIKCRELPQCIFEARYAFDVGANTLQSKSSVSWRIGPIHAAKDSVAGF